MRPEFIVFFLFLAIFLYAKAGGKIAIPGIGSAVGTLRSILFREQIATTVLFALFLITFSYAFGDSWSRVFGWWWNSQMAIPLIFAVIGVILFANCEWRKKINKELITLIGILIAGTLAINALIGWWEEGEKSPAPTIADIPPSIPQPAVVVAPEPPKNREESVEQEVSDTIIARNDDFTEVKFPPMARLVKFRWDDAPDGCVVAIYSDDMPNGAKFPCDSTVRNTGTITKIGFASDIPGVSLSIPIRYTYVPHSGQS